MAIITVDGNIGCGKSSVLEYLHTRYGVAVDLEPVQKWQPFLNELYTTGKSAFEFQVRVWLDRCWVQQREMECAMFMERSPYFQAKVFVPMNFHLNRISENEWNMLNEMYQVSMDTWSPHRYIYLRSNPEACMERIERRNRQNEDKIDIDYIRQLHGLHEKAYSEALAKNMNVVCIDVEGKTIEEIGDALYANGCV